MGFLAGFLCYEFYGLLALAGLMPGFQAILTRTSPMEFFSYSVVVVGIIEETFKYLPFALVVLRFRSFDERIDGIVYAATLAVGFSSFENLAICSACLWMYPAYFICTSTSSASPGSSVQSLSRRPNFW